MARLFSVTLTDSLLTRLDIIETFLSGVGAAQAHAALLVDLRKVVIPNLRRFPQMGRRYLDRPPQSAEALTELAALPSGVADTLRVYLSADYLILYAVVERERIVHLLSIRHHRQLSFNFARHWES